MLSSPIKFPAPGQKPSQTNQQPNDPINIVTHAISTTNLQPIDLCAPGDEVDVNRHLIYISIRTGLSRGECSALCEITPIFERLPKVRTLIESTLCFSLAHLHTVASSITGLSPDRLDAAEPHLLEMLTPTRPRQATTGVCTLSRLISDLVFKYDDCARSDGTQWILESKAVALSDTDDGKHKGVTAIFRNDRAVELTTRVQGVRNTGVNHDEQCTQVEALLQLAQRSTDAEIVINAYREAGGGLTWVDGVDWLDGVATEERITRAIHICIPADGKVDGYRPAKNQVARVRDCDDTYRLPGCDVPTSKCGLDHIQLYNHDNPEQGGPADMGNLYCPCHRYHDLKTHKGRDIDQYSDETEAWTFHDGGTVASAPVGPLRSVGK